MIFRFLKFSAQYVDLTVTLCNVAFYSKRPKCFQSVCFVTFSAYKSSLRATTRFLSWADRIELVANLSWRCWIFAKSIGHIRQFSPQSHLEALSFVSARRGWFLTEVRETDSEFPHKNRCTCGLQADFYDGSQLHHRKKHTVAYRLVARQRQTRQRQYATASCYLCVVFYCSTSATG
jgi:hypothetical protein